MFARPCLGGFLGGFFVCFFLVLRTSGDIGNFWPYDFRSLGFVCVFLVCFVFGRSLFTSLKPTPFGNDWTNFPVD